VIEKLTPTVDPTVRLALALSSSRGAYAALLGSGVSAAAGIPTGRQIVADLIAKLAALEGTELGDDPFAWYRGRFGEEPDYSKLLDELATSPTQRSELLRGYFEPTDEQRRQGLRVPGVSHHALAHLAARGYITVFVTTNFDRLLEHALERAGVEPTILSTPDSLDGTGALARNRCTVLKVNGDYLDTRIKNTPAELEFYHPAVERLLDRVLDEYGLIVCGWSADWDTALRRAFERVTTHRYATFWAARKPPTGEAARLFTLRRAELVPIKDADTLFTDLVAKLGALDKEPPGTAGRMSTPVAAHLPAQTAAFIGRRTELSEIGDRLKDPAARLLTLLGPGGTGKTTVAIEAAKAALPEFPDGVIFVDLSRARDTNAVLTAITRAIGLSEQVERPSKEVLADHMRERRLLLVLDNFEQVTAAAALVAELLAECPSVHILVTSRETLHLRGEHTYPIPPLALPPAAGRDVSAEEVQAFEATQFFLDRAKAVRPDFELTDENAPAVAEICRRLDGLPLAIELAAARLRLLSPEALLHQLGDRLKLLRSGPRDLPERQRALRATMDWSYELLKPEEQRLFQMLAVFADTDLDAIEAVTALADPGDGGTPDVLDGLTSLIEKSLIRRVGVLSRETRFAMLETIREYARDRLDQHPDIAARIKHAHASYYADLVQRARPELTGADRLVALSGLAAEVGNLRLAWRYWVAREELAQLEKLAGGLLILNEARGWYLDTVGLTADMLAVLAKGGASPDRINQEIALRTSLARALMSTKGYTPEVEEAFGTSLELFERGGTHSHQQFSALRALAGLYNLRGDPQRGTQLGRQLLAFAEQVNNPEMLVEGHLLVGANKMFVDDLAGGLDHLDRAIAIGATLPPHAFSSPAGGNDPRVACFTTSAITLWLLGYPERAAERMNEALTLSGKLSHPFTDAFARFHSCVLHVWLRDFDTVLERAADLLDIAEDHGFQIWKAAGTIVLGAARVGVGQSEEGLANVAAGMNLYQGLRSPPVFWPMLLSIQAAAFLHAGRPAEGLPRIDPAIEMMSSDPGTSLLSELYVLKGDLLLALATQQDRDVAEAEHWYLLALGRARALNVGISQLRAATRICRVSTATSGRDSAIHMLAQIATRFDDGPLSHDLREAKELLNGLAGVAE
jgi:predicted ATPase